MSTRSRNPAAASCILCRRDTTTSAALLSRTKITYAKTNVGGGVNDVMMGRRGSSSSSSSSSNVGVGRGGSTRCAAFPVSGPEFLSPEVRRHQNTHTSNVCLTSQP
jgi:hypothetical protein